MAKKSFGKSVYAKKAYWYHISTSLKHKYIKLVPWDEHAAKNRCGSEPPGKRICVAPTIEQCITAVPYILSAKFNIYRTKERVTPRKPYSVFDQTVTEEGWLDEPTEFVKIGMINFTDVEKGLGIKQVISTSAVGESVAFSGKVLKWWQNARIKKFVKKA